MYLEVDGEMNHKPSPLYVAMLLDHALLTLIVRLLATPATLAQRDVPCPSGVFSSDLSIISPSSMLVLEDAALAGDLANPSDAPEDDAESEYTSSRPRYASSRPRYAPSRSCVRYAL